MMRHYSMLLGIILGGNLLVGQESVGSPYFFEASVGKCWKYAGEDFGPKGKVKHYSVNLKISDIRVDGQEAILSISRRASLPEYNPEGPEEYLLDRSGVIDYDTGLRLIATGSKVGEQRRARNGDRLEVSNILGVYRLGEVDFHDVLVETLFEKEGRVIRYYFSKSHGLIKSEIYKSLANFKKGKISYLEVLVGSC